MIGGPKNFALRLLLIAVFLGVWEAFVRLFEIPLFIEALGLDYLLFLDHTSAEGDETVLFAVERSGAGYM